MGALGVEISLWGDWRAPILAPLAVVNHCRVRENGAKAVVELTAWTQPVSEELRRVGGHVGQLSAGIAQR